MTPNNIVNMAMLNGLDVIAVSDHNCARNLPAVFSVAEKAGMLVIPAIEVCTSEEVHVLCLFYQLEPVSYTHLDVYKRQPLHLSASML